MSTDPLFVKQNGQHYFYHTDHLGTPQKLTAVNGAVVWSAMYSAFGQAQVLPLSTVENHLRFPGQYYDTETGLHYNYHRYYDPSIGRYLRADPVGLKGGMNFFLYVSNNSPNKADPWGLLEAPQCSISGCDECEISREKVWQTTDREPWEETRIDYIAIFRMRLHITLCGITFCDGSTTFIIGEKLTFVEYAYFWCYKEVCLTNMASPEYCGCKIIEGTQTPVIQSTTDIPVTVDNIPPELITDPEDLFGEKSE